MRCFLCVMCVLWYVAVVVCGVSRPRGGVDSWPINSAVTYIYFQVVCIMGGKVSTVHKDRKTLFTSTHVLFTHTVRVVVTRGTNWYTRHGTHDKRAMQINSVRLTGKGVVDGPRTCEGVASENRGCYLTSSSRTASRPRRLSCVASFWGVG